MPEARAPLYRKGTGMTTVTAKLPVLSKKDATAIRARLRKGANIPIEELDDEELLAVVEDGHVLSGITKQEIEISLSISIIFYSFSI